MGHNEIRFPVDGFLKQVDRFWKTAFLEDRDA
jgi:hypothetical protein